MTLEELAAIIDPDGMDETNVVLAGGWDRQAHALRRADAILTAQAAERGVDAGVVEILQECELVFEQLTHKHQPLVARAQSCKISAFLAAQGGRANV